MKGILHILIMLIIFFLPTVFLLTFYKIQKQLSGKKILYLTAFALVQIFCSVGIVLALDLDLGAIIVFFIGFSLIKAYLFSIIFKAPMVKTVILFSVLDIIFISLLSWFFLGYTQPAVEDGSIPENLI